MPQPTPSDQPDPDAAFLASVADTLMALPGVEAVALGGSRAQGTHREDSDWDLGIYYRDGFDPESLRAVGWPGEVSALGAWGGGLFNGGAWLTIAGRRVDVLYRDLAVIEHELAEAEAGRFHTEALMFHLAVIPSYLVIAELGINRVLRGDLPRPSYPEPLQRSAAAAWMNNAELLFSYAEANHALHGRLAQTAGMIVQATTCAAQAIAAARGQWVTNEKSLLDTTGLREIDALVASLTTDPSVLQEAVAAARDLCRDRLNRPGAAAG